LRHSSGMTAAPSRGGPPSYLPSDPSRRAPRRRTSGTAPAGSVPGRHGRASSHITMP